MKRQGALSLHGPVFWICVGTLLILRIPLQSWMEYARPATAAWIEPLAEVGTYVLILFLIGWERESLARFNVNALAVWLVVLGKPLSLMVLPLMGQKPTPFEFPNALFWVFPLAACLLGLGIWKKRIVLPRLAPSEGVWFLAGASIGLLWFALEGIVYIHWLNFPVPAYQGPLMLLAPVYQMGYAAVPEEMVFRAFLWGGLRKIGVPAFWVLMIQSVLFTAAHIHLLRTPAPAVYLGSVFLTAVILGLLVWRSRRISTGMACHAFGNGSQLFQYWINTLVFR